MLDAATLWPDIDGLLTRCDILTFAAEPETGDLIHLNQPARQHLVAGPDEIPHVSELLSTDSLRHIIENILPELSNGGSWQGNLETVEGSTLDVGLVGVIDDGELLRIVGIGRDITAEADRLAELAHQATHDELTGLASPAGLMHRIDELSTASAPFAVTYIDLDGFKVINDNYGHDVGDDLLRSVAERLERSIRPSDVVARIGSDEFAVVLGGISQVDDAANAAQRLIELVAAPGLEADGQQVQLSASAGVAVASSEIDSSELLSSAEGAMHQAKATFPGTVSIYGDEARWADRRRHGLARQLEPVITNRLIRASYQPLYDLETNQIVGVEALARWPQPDGSSVSPVEFIPLATDLGLIRDLDDLVMETAMMAIAPMVAGSTPLQLRVNVSAPRLDQYLPERVFDILERFGFDPGRLVIEVTEDALAQDPATAESIAQRLSDEGVGMSLDDFGTGYSSLSNLTNFELDSLKIDRVFVDGLGRPDSSSTAVVNAVMSLAEALGIGVVAEGIETEAQRHALMDAGCRIGQGFLMSKPITIDELADLLNGVARPTLPAAADQAGSPGL